MKLKGRGISRGKAEGTILLNDTPISFLGEVNPSTGELIDLPGSSIKDRVFAFPRGKGSTVGSYVMLEMKRVGTLPTAIINESAEPIVATGAVLSEVPLVDGIDLSLLCEGDLCIIDGSEGTVELPDVKEVHAVSSFIHCGDEVLLLKRSNKVGSFKDHWAAVSGYVEDGETAKEAAIREIQEEIGVINPELIRSGESVKVRDGNTIWIIHPYLFRINERSITLDWEHTEYRWMLPDAIKNMKTVPELEEVYRSLLE
ncbi:MAG: DUF126 domain-containing protein [Euryarchaeota archaeon]|nr:DUF126 domain-containing protein [Euryarchaeota archaeon]